LFNFGPYFGGTPFIVSFDIHPDGERFLVITGAAPGALTGSTDLVLVQNWFEERKRLVPTD
jgi:hypothetical protein